MLAVWQGYKAEVVKRKGVQRLRVCLSCARAMRGRYKLESLPPNTPFACAMGEGQCGMVWCGLACGVVWCGMACLVLCVEEA